MSFRIVVTELIPGVVEGQETEEIERYRQVVDQVDLAKLFQAINTPPRKPRVRKAKAKADK